MPLQHGIDRAPIDAGALHADMRYPAAVSQSRSASSSRLTVRNVRTSLRARAPAAPISRHATTVSWCTSSPQHRSMSACVRASLPRKATVTPQVCSRHCHTCSPFPGATKNSTSMQRGPDCLSGSTPPRMLQPQHDRRSQARTNRPMPPPFSIIMVRAPRNLAAYINVQRSRHQNYAASATSHPMPILDDIASCALPLLQFAPYLEEIGTILLFRLKHAPSPDFVKHQTRSPT